MTSPCGLHYPETNQPHEMLLDMGPSESIRVAYVDRISNSGNHIVILNEKEHNIGELSVSDTSNDVLVRTDGKKAEKVFVEKEWTEIEIDKIKNGWAYADIGDGWRIVITDKVNFYDLSNIAVDFGRDIEVGDKVRVKIENISKQKQTVKSSPLLIEGGLYEARKSVRKIDKDRNGIIAGKYSDAQVDISGFGGFGSKKVMFRVDSIYAPKVYATRYFYSGERIFLTPDTEGTNRNCLFNLNDGRQIEIKDVQSCTSRIEVEIIESSYDKITAEAVPPEANEEGGQSSKVTEPNIEEDDSPSKKEEPGSSDSVNENSQSHDRGQNTSDAVSSSKSQVKSDDSTPERIEREESLELLREEALNDATDVATEYNNSSTKQYTRSEKVKNYVKARADGLCEGCEEPAPFVSKTGEPYLHVHHIKELSNGGSDNPSNVVALCPNCHYRVHHGEEGEEYNEKLAEMINSREKSGT